MLDDMYTHQIFPNWLMAEGLLRPKQLRCTLNFLLAAAGLTEISTQTFHCVALTSMLRVTCTKRVTRCLKTCLLISLFPCCLCVTPDSRPLSCFSDEAFKNWKAATIVISLYLTQWEVSLSISRFQHTRFLRPRLCESRWVPTQFSPTTSNPSANFENLCCLSYAKSGFYCGNNIFKGKWLLKEPPKSSKK